MGWIRSLLKPGEPWYAAGLAFECGQCGRCCAGPNEGYVWVSDVEITAIAAFLSMTPEDLRRQYVRRTDGRHTLIERPDNHDCIFLTAAGDAAQSRGCRIYSVRPAQCRTWPFWPGNLHSPESWSHAAQRCPGVNRGQKFSLEQIHERMRPPDSHA
jgi:Fe-S-cluster containining protein